MTKDEIKLLCEDNQQLQWWAMVLFAEISELVKHGHKNDTAIWQIVEAKVDEFPKLVVSEALQNAKKRISNEC